MIKPADDGGSEGSQGPKIFGGFLAGLLLFFILFAALLVFGINGFPKAIPGIYAVLLVGAGALLFRRRDTPLFFGMLVACASLFLLNAACALAFRGLFFDL